MTTKKDPPSETDKVGATRDSHKGGEDGMITEVHKTIADTKPAPKPERGKTSKGYTNTFGKISLEDSSADKPKEHVATKIGDNKAHVDTTHSKVVPAADVTPEQAAKNIRSKADADLESAHKHLKVTTDGSAPKALAPMDHYATDGHKTPLDIARERLGSNATKEQVTAYASDI